MATDATDHSSSITDMDFKKMVVALAPYRLLMAFAKDFVGVKDFTGLDLAAFLL